MLYRNRTTHAIYTQDALRRANPNVSFSRVWNTDTYDAVGVDPVFNSPEPDVTNLQQVLPDGAVQDELGKWVEKWRVVDKFEANELHTKAEQETAFLQGLEDTAFESLRTERNRLLAETDYFALSDVTMSAEMTEYRKLLRDLPENTEDVFNPVYPEKP